MQVISGFRLGVNGIFTLLRLTQPSLVVKLSTFRGYLLVPSSTIKQSKEMSPISCPESLVTNYQATLRNVPEERKSRKMLIMLSKHIFSNIRFNIIIPFSSALSSERPLSMLLHS